jgi:nucleotide-binding universal stress UspA family protein
MATTSIVVGIDGSDASGRALALAVKLAARHRGYIHACYIAHLPTAVMIGSFLGPAIPVADDLDETVEHLSRLVMEELGNAEVGGDFAWTQGDVATELQHLAATHNADLMVVGRSAHPHLHVGNVPSRLITTGWRPVLVVP